MDLTAPSRILADLADVRGVDGVSEAVRFEFPQIPEHSFREVSLDADDMLVTMWKT
jgi:hypothetical protein